VLPHLLQEPATVEGFYIGMQLTSALRQVLAQHAPLPPRGAALHPHSKDSLKLFHCSMYELEAVALHAATFPKILVRPLMVATIPELSWIIVVFSPLRACVLPAQQEQCDIRCISLMLHVTSIITLVSLEREAWAEQRT